jgi:hypothetical protein
VFTMPVTYNPPQVVLVASSTTTNTDIHGNNTGAGIAPIGVLTFCQPVGTQSSKSSAERSVDPAGVLNNAMPGGVDTSSVVTALVAKPTHGTITAEVANTGYLFYGYDPEPGYLGPDQAVFVAVLHGKSYRIIINFTVVKVVDNSDVAPADPCFHPDVEGPGSFPDDEDPASGTSTVGASTAGAVTVTVTPLAEGVAGKPSVMQSLSIPRRVALAGSWIPHPTRTKNSCPPPIQPNGSPAPACRRRQDGHAVRPAARVWSRARSGAQQRFYGGDTRTWRAPYLVS